MKRFALAQRLPDGTVDIDERDFLAESSGELPLVAEASGMRGRYEVLEFVEGGYFAPDWSYEDELRELNLLN